jgi:hypothetical protein
VVGGLLDGGQGALATIAAVLLVVGPEAALRRHIFVPQHFWQYVALHFGFGPPGTRITVGQFLWDPITTQVWLAAPVGLLAASLSVWNAERPRDHKLATPPSGSPWMATCAAGRLPRAW